jgi:very-short-patch-repair endonuclease
LPAKIVRGQKIDPAKIARAKELRRAMTTEERRLWQALRRNTIGGLHFRRQQVIAGFIVDFYCHSAALAVEVDGATHRETVEYDKERDQILAARGVLVIRFSNAEVRNRLPYLLSRIAEFARRPNPRPLP